MATKHKADIKKLEKKIAMLNDALTELAENQDTPELLRIIHGPGWTTPAELLFAVSALEAMLQQAALLQSMNASLLSASKLVGEFGE